MTTGFQSEMFDVLPWDGQLARRTPDGKPWVRWEKRKDSAGWFTPGTRRLGGPSVFWKITLNAASKALGTFVDGAHCVGLPILSMGALGITVASGYGQLLLRECLVCEPEVFLNTMAPVLATGARIKSTGKSPSGVALVDSNGQLALTVTEIGEVIRLGCGWNKWTRQAERHARIWVTSVSALLRDERMDRAQQKFASIVLPTLLSDRVALGLRWPRDGAEGTWQYTRERQVLWAFAMVLGIFGRDAASVILERVFREAADDSDEELLRALVSEIRVSRGRAGDRRARVVLGHVARGFEVKFANMELFAAEE